MDVKQIFSLIQTVTGGVILALVVWAIITRKLVPGWVYDSKAAECQKWESAFLGKIDPSSVPRVPPTT